MSFRGFRQRTLVIATAVVFLVVAVLVVSICLQRVRARALLLGQLNAMGAVVETEGIATFGTSIRSVNFQGCGVTDEIVASLGQFQEIERLDLSGTAITDEALRAMEDMKNLKWLDLSETRITDAGVVHLSRLHRLESLFLCETDVSDESVGVLSSMASLTILGVPYTKVSADGCNRLASPRLTVEWIPRDRHYSLRKKLKRFGADLVCIDIGNGNIEYMMLVGTDWSGSIADFNEVNSCENLTQIAVRGLWFNDDYLTSILTLPKVRVVVLRSTSVTDSGCLAICRCPSLRELTVESTRISEGVLKHLRSANPRLRIVASGIRE